MLKECMVCGANFKTKKSHYERRKTCSIKCLSVMKREVMSGEGNHQWGLRGEKNCSWRGGVVITNGYRKVYRPDHPNAREEGYVLEHRMVASSMLGRAIRDDEHVHHVNGDRLDNRPENLEVMDAGRHVSLHNALNPSPRGSVDGRFKCCGASYKGDRVWAKCFCGWSGLRMPANITKPCPRCGAEPKKKVKNEHG